MSKSNASDETLVLVPTEFESKQLSIGKASRVEVCGFGMVAAAARAAFLLAQHKPKRVILAGIAGAYKEQLSVGCAYLFSTVACYGIGSGTGEQFRTANELGWPMMADANKDQLSLNLPAAMTELDAGLLLSVASAADGHHDSQLRLEKYPKAVAEDMEAFAVAFACRAVDVPLTVIRGISNRAGDRNKANWKIDEAMQAVSQLVTIAIEN